ncbi:MAG: hypothetical protein WAN81_18825 [Candidatus Binataceae bacterium]
MRASGGLELREPRREVVLAYLELFEVATHGNQRVVSGGKVAFDDGPGLHEGAINLQSGFGPDAVDCLSSLHGHFRLSSVAGAFELPPKPIQLSCAGLHLIGGLCELITEMGCLFRHFLASKVVSASHDVAAQAI